MHTIYVDVSELLANRLHTGIQRVGRRIIHEGLAIAPEIDVKLVPVVALGRRFHKLSEQGLAVVLDPPKTSSGVMLTSGGFPLRAIKALLRATPTLYRFAQAQFLRGRLRVRLAGLFEAQPVQFQHRDRLVLLDSLWGGSTALSAAIGAKRSGAGVVAVIYDMIPVTHPEFCISGLARVFPGVIAQAIEVSDGLLAISRYSARVASDFAAKLGHPRAARHFYLGNDFVHVTPSGGVGEADRWPPRLWDDGGRVHVMLGTIEPRKRHAVVLDAFERRWRNGHDEKLLIIGKIGWEVEALIVRLRSHPELGRRLFLEHNATDTMVADAFRRSHAAIIASAVEGFGLPLVEAMTAGLPVIASDIEVFREIAGDAALFFTVDDPDDLARAIERMRADEPRLRQVAADFHWIDWREAARQFLAEVVALTPDPR